MIEIQIIIRITWENVYVEMPQVLVSRGFIMLSRRNSITQILHFHGNSHLLNSAVHLREYSVRYLVNVLEVIIGNDYNVTGIFRPPLRRYKSSYQVISINNIILIGVIILSALSYVTKWTLVVARLVVEHHLHFTSPNYYVEK